MTRRQLLSGAAAVAFGPQSRAQLRPAIDYPDYGRCLPNYLRALAAGAYQRRSAEIAKLTTADAVRGRQKWARETLWRLIGGPLHKTPLNSRMTGSFERPKYRVENWVYESRPGLIVAANLYIPKEARPPFPGVLFQ